MSARIGAVIPTLNAAATLERAIGSVSGDPVAEIVVADGGSTDGTAELAERLGASVVRTGRGRGRQMKAGAEALGEPDWLLFLHADTALSPSWRAEAANFIAMPGNARRAAAFRLRFDSDAPEARRWERRVAWRCRTFGLPYGDQGLLISRGLYDRLGGFRPLPLMEDVDMVRRIGRRRLHVFDAAATTSAAKFERDGWTARSALNLTCLALYFLGVPPRIIARLYGR
jgi:rSAM/selenodomain-associated transferase 2